MSAVAEWHETRLKNLFISVRNGIWGDDPDGETDVFCARGTDFDRTTNRISDAKMPRRSASASALRDHQLLRGDLVLEKSGGSADQPVGSVAMFDLSAHVVCSNFNARMQVATSVDSRFACYLMNGLYWSGFTRQFVNQTTGIQNLDANALLARRCTLPPLDEQRRIADFLDAETTRIDKLRHTTNLQVSVLEKRRIEQFRAATTGSFAVCTRGTNVAWMPRMSHAWTLFKVGRAFLAGSGTTPRSSEPRYFDGPHRWINTGDLRDGPVASSQKLVSDAALRDYSALRIYPAGTLMVAMYGATTGRVGINAVPACVNQACCALTSTGILDTTYAFYWLLAHRPEILRLASGGGQPNISQDLVRMLRIPAPESPGEQQYIVNQCDEINSQSSAQQAQLIQRSSLLAERRQALITAAVTGQIDVTTARGVAT